MSLLGCRSSASEKVCFWCPLKYSNWEILGNFIWSCNSSQGQLGTNGRVGCLLPSGVDSVKEGESLLFMSLGFQLICHNATPTISARQDACSKSMYQEMFHNQGCKAGVLNCEAQGRCISRESMDRGGLWISSVWPDWIFTNDIKLSWVTRGLSDWVATGSGFLFLLGSLNKLNPKNTKIKPYKPDYKQNTFSVKN